MVPGEGVITLGHPNGVARIFASPGQFIGPYTYAGDQSVLEDFLWTGQDINRPFLNCRMHTEQGDSGSPLLNSYGQVVGIQDRRNLSSRATSTPVEDLEAFLTGIHSRQYTQYSYCGQPFGS